MGRVQLKELIHQPGKPAWGLNPATRPIQLKELIHQAGKKRQSSWHWARALPLTAE